MKRSQLLESFGDGVLSKIVINLGVAGEIEFTDDDPAIPEHHIVSFHADASSSGLKFTRDGKGQLILTVDPSSFVIDGVEAPPEEPATEPMIGADGQVLVGDVVDGIVGGLAVDGAVPGEGFDALEAVGGEGEAKKPKSQRGKAKASEPKRCPHPNCLREEEHDGDHEFPAEDPNA